jgi:Domain of unknown function (DUF4190)
VQFSIGKPTAQAESLRMDGTTGQRGVAVSSFCVGCGNSIAEGERFCAACGRDSQASASLPAIDPQVAFGLPPETSTKAIFSLICGVFFIIVPFSIIAIILGYIALSEIRRSPGRLMGRGLAITGIVLGYVGILLVVAFVGLGVYEVRKAEGDINEPPGDKSIVASMRTLNMAEIAYGQAHRELGYTCSLSQLSGAWQISSELVGGRKHGYQFELKNCTSTKPGGPVAKYQLLVYSADPVTTEAPAYCTDESDIIRMTKNGPAQDCFAVGTRWDDPGTKSSVVLQ